MTNFNQEHIVLIGFMGVGKSTIADIIAQKLNRQVVDTDSVIQASQGISISEIFELHGESYFRQQEKELLLKIFDSDPSIISTGGGLPCFYDNMKVINDNAISVKLLVGVDRLVERLLNSVDRPLIKSMSKKTLRKYVSSKLKERNLHYNKADITVRAIGDPLQVAHRIMKRIKKMNK